MNKAAKIIRIETICNGSSPSKTNNLKKEMMHPKARILIVMLKNLCVHNEKRPL